MVVESQVFTTLHLAVWRGHEECVKLLLSGGADFNSRNNFFRTALMAAAATGTL